MNHQPDVRQRRSLRLAGYNYAQAGAYFVTICTQGRACLFGVIEDGAMRLNDAGMMVETWWNECPGKFSTITVDEYVVMPNHFHGIILTGVGAGLVGADLCVCPDHRNAGGHTRGRDHRNEGAHAGAPLPAIVQWFKTMTTNAYIRGVKQHGWQPFSGKLWQRNYYEHIIRDEVALDRIRNYIVNNPLCWALDCENPAIARIKQGEP